MQERAGKDERRRIARQSRSSAAGPGIADAPLPGDGAASLGGAGAFRAPLFGPPLPAPPGRGGSAAAAGFGPPPAIPPGLGGGGSPPAPAGFREGSPADPAFPDRTFRGSRSGRGTLLG